MGGININQKHNLTINSKSLSFYILASLVLLTLLSFIIISIRISFLNAIGNEGTGDTGTATLNSVSILQAGTGQSVTIKGETLNENDYGADNTTRRTILNNNIVRYNANYNVTKVGQITFSITLPANNTIDEATIAESQGCLPNLSKLESADITNSDGTITKSYTNNKATCVRNITTTGSTNWQITAYLWGANNTKIQPTLAVSGETSTVKPEEISVVGKPNYKLYIQPGYGGIASGGVNAIPRLEFGLYIPIESGAYGNGDAVLGVEPLDGNIELSFDISQMPQYAYITGCSGTITNGGILQVSEKYGNIGERSCSVSNDNIVYLIDDIPTATREYGSQLFNNSTSSWADGYAFYAVGGFTVSSPVGSIPDTPTAYEVTWSEQRQTTSSGTTTAVYSNIYSLTWLLSSASSGTPKLYWERNAGWGNDFGSEWPMYTGESQYLTPAVEAQTVPSGSYSTNMQYCVSWRGDEVAPTGQFDINTKFTFGEPVVYEFGVLAGGASALPESALSNCGYVGDSKSSVSFFSDISEARRYASENGTKINAFRLTASRVANGLSRIGNMHFVITDKITESRKISFNYSLKSDQYSQMSNGTLTTISRPYVHTLVPGLLSHTLTAIPSSTNPGKEDHITITAKTYNKDTNSKITINLPNGLTPKEGSFTITTGYTHNDVTNTNEPIKAVLIEGENQDYTITANGSSSAGSEGGSGSSGGSDGSSAGNVSYTIALDLDHIASTHHVPITGYDPIYPGESGVTNITLNSDTGLYEEVITTNNNNEDSDINNDDLPIAADNDGNGIDHIGTPIEFDVTVNEDTPSPSTLTINSTASGTGTDYASATFKTASDTIAVAEPPKTFGYDLTTSSNNIYAGDDLTYSYSISNTTDTNATNIQMLTVLPFNGDSRGTTGLKNLEEETTQASSSSTNDSVSDGSSTTNPSTITNPYAISHLSLSLPGDGASGLDTSATKLYYALDPKAHELEPNPEALALDSSITWQELELDSDGNIPDSIMTNLQDQGILDSITALKLTTTTLPSSSSLKLNVTLDNILATTPGSEATLVNDITYLSYASETNQAVEQVAEQTVEGTTNTNTDTATNTNTKTILRREGNTTTYSNGQIVSVHQNPVKVAYLGELLALNIPEHEQVIQVTLGLNDVVIGNPSISDDNTNPVNHLNLVTATLRGYNLTIQTDTENGALVAEGNPLRLIPSIATKPTKGTAGWSANIAGSNNQSLAGTAWTAIPGSNQTPLNLYASAAKGRDSRNLTVTYGFSAANTIADTYSARVVYTVTAGL